MSYLANYSGQLALLMRNNLYTNQFKDVINECTWTWWPNIYIVCYKILYAITYASVERNILWHRNILRHKPTFSYSILFKTSLWFIISWHTQSWKRKCTFNRILHYKSLFEMIPEHIHIENVTANNIFYQIQ